MASPSKAHEEEKLVYYPTKLPCPECGAALFRYGNELWCSRQGSSDIPGCSYGMLQVVTLEQYLERMNRDYYERHWQEEHDKATRW